MSSKYLNVNSATTLPGADAADFVGGIGAISDESDASYAVLHGDDGAASVSAGMRLGFDASALPDESLVRWVMVTLRDAGTFDPTELVLLAVGGVSYGQGVKITWDIDTGPDPPTGWRGHFGPAIGLHGFVHVQEPLTEAEVDAATVDVSLVYETARFLWISKVELLVSYVTQPVVTAITNPLDGATVTTDNTPRYEWYTLFDADSLGHSAFEVRVFDHSPTDPISDTAVDESGVQTDNPAIPPFTSWIGRHYGWQGDTVLENGNYWVSVRHADIGWDDDGVGTPHWSEWLTIDFVVDVDAPNAPDLATTSQPNGGRIKIDFTDNPGGAATTTHWQLQASDDGGETWRYIRTSLGDGLHVVASETYYDFDAPNGVTVQYRGRAVHKHASNAYGYSDWTTASDSWTSSVWWVKHPDDSTLNFIADLRSQPSRTRVARVNAHEPLGRTKPVVVSDVPGAWGGEIVFRSDETQRDALTAITADNRPLLIQSPPDAIMWTDSWVKLGDFTEERALDQPWLDLTFDTTSWVEVDAP